MEQKFISEGTKISAALMFFCAFITLPLAIGALASYPDPIWWIGFLFLFASIALTLNGIKNLRVAKQVEKNAREDVMLTDQQLNTAYPVPDSDKAGLSNPTSNKQAPPTKNDTIILAHWKYTEEEWKSFSGWEVKKRQSNSAIEAILIIILGTFFADGMLNANFWMALSISTAVAILYWAGKYFLSIGSYGKKRGKINEVVITQYAVIINGKHNPFQNEMYWPGPINIIEDCTPQVLEILYNWSSRKGNTHDEIRIPIPEGKLEEARWIAKTL